MNSFDSKKFDILYDFLKNSALLSDSLRLLGQVKETIQELVECDRILLFVDEREQDCLTAPKAFNFSQPESESVDISYDDPIIKHILIDRQSTSRIAYKNPVLPSAKSELFVPLISPDITFGCLYLARQKEISFSKEEIQIIEFAANILAVSLERAERENHFQQIQDFSRVWQKKYISILESMPFPAAIVNMKDDVIYEVNQKMADIFAHEGEKLFSTPFSQICHIEGQTAFADSFVPNTYKVIIENARGETSPRSAHFAELEEQRPQTVLITFLPYASDDSALSLGKQPFSAHESSMQRIDISAKIAQACNSNFNLKSLLSTAAIEMHHIIQFDYFSVTLFDEQGENTQFYALADRDVRQILYKNWKWKQIKNSNLGWLYAPPAHLKEDSVQSQKTPFVIKSHTSAFLLCGKDYLGTCTLGRVTDKVFTENEIAFLEKVAAQLALGIDHKRLLNGLKNRDHEIVAISRLSDSFVASPNLNDVLKKSCRAIKSLLTPLDCRIVKTTDDDFIANLFPWMSKSLLVTFTESHIKKMMRQLLAIRQPWLLESPEQFLKKFMDKKLALEQFKNFKPSIIAPVLHKRQLFAVLVIVINQPRISKTHDIQLVKTIVNLTQNAFTKGKPVHNVSKRSNDLQILVHTTAKELKTPVEKAQNLTVLLKKDFTAIFPQKAQEYIDKVSFNLHQIDGQTNDLVELARIGFQKLKFQEFNSVDLVASIIKSIPGLLSENHIKIIYGEKLPRISADYEGMKRVFFNLIINAVKATEKTENPTIEIGCKGNPSFFEFYVKDNGVPIPGKQRKSIFDIYPAGANGSLVGSRLAVVKKIIDLHKGKIWLESNNGSGNTFKFKISKKRKG